MTIVVNFFAGAGAGKTTLAWHTCAELKWQGINVEYVPEYVKAMVWEERSMVFKDQLYVLGKQNYAIKRLINKVNVVVTDSPIALSAYYNQPQDKAFNDMVFKVFNQYHTLNFFVKRMKKYNPQGRFQTASQARTDDEHIKNLLTFYNIPFSTIEGKPESIPMIVDLIKITLANEGKMFINENE